MISFNNVFDPWLCNAPIKSKIWLGDFLVLDKDGCARPAESVEEYKEYGIGMAIETSCDNSSRIKFIQESTKINIQCSLITDIVPAIIMKSNSGE